MNRSSLLHIVERLETFLGKLPETIRKPILHELTPLKELFLQQRSPRLAFAGSSKMPLPQVLQTLFAGAEIQIGETRTRNRSWQDVPIADRGTISVLDLRGTDFSSKSDPSTDVVFFLSDQEGARTPKLKNVAGLDGSAKIIGITLGTTKRTSARNPGEAMRSNAEVEAIVGDRFLGAFSFPPDDSRRLMSILAREISNEARIEMIRISQDREAQREIAQTLVKSTAAVCTAIGAQPIPLADLPILTTLQLTMVSGIMYVSGRERSLRAATEFVGALGANVGIGMLFREGTRALLKFFPGWGNVICGMVAGAGTYAIGRAAIVFFLEGLSLKDARRVYLRSRKKPDLPRLPDAKDGRRRAKRSK